MSQQTVETVETTEATEVAEPGDHDRFSHYVRNKDLLEATVNGREVFALCGKKWVPTRPGEKFPICPTCKNMFQQIPE